jgi:hypothetical protein
MVSNDSGEFNFQNLRPGKHDLTITTTGFKI